jgi:hypothetical protein
VDLELATVGQKEPANLQQVLREAQGLPLCREERAKTGQLFERDFHAAERKTTR